MPAHANLAYSHEDDYIYTGHSLERDVFPGLTYGNPPNHVQRATGATRSKKRYVSVAILCLINLINYMDRFTIAGKLFRNGFQ